MNDWASGVVKRLADIDAKSEAAQKKHSQLEEKIVPLFHQLKEMAAAGIGEIKQARPDFASVTYGESSESSFEVKKTDYPIVMIEVKCAGVHLNSTAKIMTDASAAPGTESRIVVCSLDSAGNLVATAQGAGNKLHGPAAILDYLIGRIFRS